MILDQRTGLIDSASYIPSPNHDYRPSGIIIDSVIIHCISLPPGIYGGCEIEDFFCNCLDHQAHPYFAQIDGTTVSAHFLIRRDGQLMQFVSTLNRAWHAGESELEGLNNVNDFSIGVELEGLDDGPFEDDQYQTLLPLLRVLTDAYPAIRPQRIVGHMDVAPGRKTDPGPCFDWSRLHEEIV